MNFSSRQAVRLHTLSRQLNMSVFMDLNVCYTPDRNRLRSLVEAAANHRLVYKVFFGDQTKDVCLSVGFSTVAINYTFEPTTKSKQEIPTPAPTSSMTDELPLVQGRSRPIRVLNRLTIVMSDSTHFRPTAAEYRRFDLLAVQPTTEKLFHAVCMTLDVDIVCIPVTEKLPFVLKRAPVNGAVDRGVVFEVSYAASIRDSTMRRYTIANANALMDTCKGKNVILSSGAEKPLELRGPYDIINLGLLFGLSDGDAKEAVSSTCRTVLLHAETRKTASGIIYTVKSCGDLSSQQEAPPAAEDSEAPAAKKARPHLSQ